MTALKGKKRWLTLLAAAAAGLLSVVTPVGEALLLAVAQAALQAASERRAEVVAAKFVS